MRGQPDSQRWADAARETILALHVTREFSIGQRGSDRGNIFTCLTLSDDAMEHRRHQIYSPNYLSRSSNELRQAQFTFKFTLIAATLRRRYRTSAPL